MVACVAHLLGAESLELEFPTRKVFEKVTLAINEGDRIGLTGRNGDGKSTLLSLLAGRLEPDAGKVTRRTGLSIGFLDQADRLDPSLTVSQAVVGNTADYVWASNPKIRQIINGLLADLDWQGPVAALSGGQRRRVSLAAVLVGDWDLLFLDEPTNHLDLEAIYWLAEHLKSRWTKKSGGLLVVTHDRWFLDEVCTSTWEVHDGLVEPFEGGYAAYILQRVDRDRQAAVAEAKRQNLLRKELAWLRRGAPARTSKPKFRIEAANALIADVPAVRESVQLQQLAMRRLGKDVVDLEEASVSYAGRQEPVLKKITWRLAPGERSGILGGNGAGKSTLLGLIDGSLSPSSGRVKRGKTVRVASLSQQLGELDALGQDRVLDVIGRQKSSYYAAGKEFTPGQLLERLGFSQGQLATPVADLSGGQKRRLQLLLILLDEPNVLILDEPSNDLDTDMLAAMEDLLDTWPGTLLVVSHDRYLLERVTDQQYALLDGQLRHLPGGVDQYLQLMSQRSAAEEAALKTADFSRQQEELAAAKPSAAEHRAAQKEMKQLERKLEQLAQLKEGLHEQLAAHDQADYEELARLGKQLQEVTDKIEEQEARWMELAEVLH